MIYRVGPLDRLIPTTSLTTQLRSLTTEVMLTPTLRLQRPRLLASQ